MTDLDVITDFYAALARGESGPALARFWTDDAVTVTHPNLVAPAGGVTDRAAMQAGSEAGARLLAWQRFEVVHARSAGDEVVVRSVWTGEVRADAGPFRAGQRLRAAVAQFVTVRDGRIARVETFDCYDPLG